MNMEEAVKATKDGAIAAVVLATFTLGYWLVRFDSTDPSYAISISIIILCTYGIYKKSRVAAIVVFIYLIFIIGMQLFIVSKIGAIYAIKSTVGIGITLYILYSTGKAIQGSFVYHKLMKLDNPEYKSTPKWLAILSSIIGILLLIMFIFGYLIENGHVYKTDYNFETSINGDQTWSESSINGYNNFFNEIAYEKMVGHEELKQLPDQFLQEQSLEQGRCITAKLMENYNNPSALRNGLMEGDPVIGSAIRLAYNTCL